MSEQPKPPGGTVERWALEELGNRYIVFAEQNPVFLKRFYRRSAAPTAASQSPL